MRLGKDNPVLSLVKSKTLCFVSVRKEILWGCERRCWNVTVSEWYSCVCVMDFIRTCGQCAMYVCTILNIVHSHHELCVRTAYVYGNWAFAKPFTAL